MKRRAILGLGATFFSGCTTGYTTSNSRTKDNDELVEDQSINISERRCLKNGDPIHDAQISISNRTAEISGTIRTHKPCVGLTVVPARHEMKNGSMTDDIDIDIYFIENSNECSWCPSEIDYTATVVFNRLPSSIDLMHIERKPERDVTLRVGPISEKSLGT